MAEITSCPDCDKKLKVPDTLLGKKVKCPGCGTLFTARGEDDGHPPRAAARGVTTGKKAPPPRRDEDDEDDRPRSRRRDEDDDEDDRPRRRDDDDYDDRRRRRDEDEDRVRGRRDDDRRRRDDDDDYDPRPRNAGGLWHGVSSGLNLWVIGAWMILALIPAYIVGFVLIWVVAMATRDLTVTAILTFLIMGLVGLAALAAVILMLVGMGMCMQAPSDRDHPTRLLAVGAFCCHTVPIALAVLSGMMLALIGPAWMFGHWGVSGLNAVLSLAGVILWALFLRSASYETGHSDLAERCMTWLVAYLIFLGVLVGVWVIAIVAAVGLGMNAVGGGLQGGGGGLVGAVVAGGLFLMLFGLVACIVGLVLYVWEIMLASEVRDAVLRRGRRRR